MKFNYYSALFAAAWFTIFLSYSGRVRMANLAPAINVIQLLILKRALPQIFQVFELYKVHQNARFVPPTLQTPYYTLGRDSISAVDACSSTDFDAHEHISLGTMEISMAERAAGIGFAGFVFGQVLTSNYKEVNTFVCPDREVPRVFRDLPGKGKSWWRRCPR